LLAGTGLPVQAATKPARPPDKAAQKPVEAFAPAENFVAIADASPTLDATLKTAYDIAAIYFPFTGLILVDPYATMSGDLRLAFYIGQSKIVGNTLTDMVAYATDDVFVQLWIGVDDKLPRRVRSVYREDPLRLRYQLDLSNWQLDSPVAADAFQTAKAQGAAHIPFAAPTIPKSAFEKPQAQGKGSKTRASTSQPAK
jgi:hypothetical protein